MSYIERNAIKYALLIIVLVVLIAVKSVVYGVHLSTTQISPFQVTIISVQLFAIIDPIGSLPFYMYFAQRLDPGEQGWLWSTVVSAMFVLLLFFSLVGGLLLKAFGVSIYSFMIGGGVLLMVLAVDIMGEGSRSLSLDPHEAAVVPLASPLLVGPGAVASLIIYSSTVPSIDLVISILIVTAISATILKYSGLIARILGKNGLTAMSRLLSIIIAGFAAQLIFEGLVGWGLLRP